VDALLQRPPAHPSTIHPPGHDSGYRTNVRSRSGTRGPRWSRRSLATVTRPGDGAWGRPQVAVVSRLRWRASSTTSQPGGRGGLRAPVVEEVSRAGGRGGRPGDRHETRWRCLGSHGGCGGFETALARLLNHRPSPVFEEVSRAGGRGGRHTPVVEEVALATVTRPGDGACGRTEVAVVSRRRWRASSTTVQARWSRRSLRPGGRGGRPGDRHETRWRCPSRLGALAHAHPSHEPHFSTVPRRGLPLVAPRT